eukprot:140424_1
MPTPTCWDGKFKWSMIKSIGENINDQLFSGESLVSVNCRFILKMKTNGNLVLNGLVGKYIDPFGKDDNGNFIHDKNKMRIYTGWETNTTLGDNSGESISVAQLKDGALMVEEHEFFGVPEFDPIELWKSDEYIIENLEKNDEHVDENELILQLSDNGCVTLNQYFGSTITDHLTPIWFVCAQLEKDRNDNDNKDYIDEISTTIAATSMLTTEIPQKDNNDGDMLGLGLYDNNNDKIQLLAIWNVIISCLLVVLVLGCLYICIKRLYENYKIADPQVGAFRSNEFGEHNYEITGKHHDDDVDHEVDKAIELWSMENTNVTATGQETGNLGL